VIGIGRKNKSFDYADLDEQLKILEKKWDIPANHVLPGHTTGHR
jgi:hypothetical protein